MTTLIRAAVLSGFVLLGASNARADEWRALDTSEFKMIGNVSERTFRRVATSINAYKYILKLSIPALDINTPVRPRVLLLKRASFEKYVQPRENVRGFVFSKGIEIDIVIDATDDGMASATQIALHELTHYYLHNAANFVVPVWYDEGLADFLSTIDVDGNILTMGKPPLSRWYSVQHLSWMPIAAVVGVRRGSPEYSSHKGALSFYAESWLMLHFANIGAKKWLPATLNLVRSADAGLSPSEAIQKAFNNEFADYERQLRSYSRETQMSYARFERPRIASDSVAVEQIPEPTGLTELALAMQRTHRDPATIEKLLTPHTADPDNLRAAAALAITLNMTDHESQVPPIAERCRATDDAETATLCGRAILAPFAHAGGQQADALRAAQGARVMFERAIRLDPNRFDAFHANVRTYQILEDSAAAFTSLLEAAVRKNPRAVELRVDLAGFYSRSGRHAAARAELERAVLDSTEVEIRDSLMRLLRDVENAEAAVEQGAKSH